MKLVHLFGFIRKRFVTMHGNVNVKYWFLVSRMCYKQKPVRLMC